MATATTTTTKRTRTRSRTILELIVGKTNFNLVPGHYTEAGERKPQYKLEKPIVLDEDALDKLEGQPIAVAGAADVLERLRERPADAVGRRSEHWADRVTATIENVEHDGGKWRLRVYAQQELNEKGKPTGRVIFNAHARPMGKPAPGRKPIEPQPVESVFDLA